ncbi:MAG: 6-bladed beta-propeller [Saprospiraceae bacterium]|nr:6-bladed beta-propeller [Saprospiraceae bacterium]
MMDRRTFIIDTAMLATSISFPFHFFDHNKNIVFGHQNKRYTWDEHWLDGLINKPSVKDCHEMVFTDKKEVILLTNDTKNNILIFDKSGKLNRSWGHDFPGAHGMTIHNEAEQYLFITDTEKHQFYKTTLNGKILNTWDCPLETGKYSDKKAFVPTETAITKEGEIYVADGYGAQYITHYDRDGHIKNIFGGRGDGDEHLDNAHGICIDYRTVKPTLIITDRNRCCFKRFTMTGDFLEKIVIPGANMCRPVISGDYLYAAVLTSYNTGNANTGFVIILDKDNQLVSAIAGTTPEYKKGICQTMQQTVKLFKHPHDVMIDDEDNLYVCQWNSGQILPMKFVPYV